MISLKPEHLDAVRRHGETDYPHECCGLLIGRLDAQGNKSVVDTIPISNAREEEARGNRFLITPDELLAGERLARQVGMDVVGFYHSHPDHSAAASQFDLEHAWPTYSYIIVSVLQGKADELLSWELTENRSVFYNEQIRSGE